MGFLLWIQAVTLVPAAAQQAWPIPAARHSRSAMGTDDGRLTDLAASGLPCLSRRRGKPVRREGRGASVGLDARVKHDAEVAALPVVTPPFPWSALASGAAGGAILVLIAVVAAR